MVHKGGWGHNTFRGRAIGVCVIPGRLIFYVYSLWTLFGYVSS